MSDINNMKDSGRGQSQLRKCATVSAAAEMNKAHVRETKSSLCPLRHMWLSHIKHTVTAAPKLLLRKSETERGQTHTV